MHPKQPNSLLKYSGLAFQMAAVIGLSAWGGQKLDAYFSNSNRVFTIVLSLTGVFVALYLTIKDFIKPPKK